MFSGIAGRYDALNHLLSFGLDFYWRRRMALEAGNISGLRALDVATGTGDAALLFARRGARVLGIDVSEEMLSLARAKAEKGGLGEAARFQYGDAEHLEFADGELDVVSCAFGARNFTNPERGIREMARALRAGGRILILEFSLPRFFALRALHLFYLRFIVSFLGGIFSRGEAYRYLGESIMSFSSFSVVECLRSAGCFDARAIPLAFGIVTLYAGVKGGRGVEFSGKARKGAGRGRELGFPTANISAPSGIADGVYAAFADFGEGRRPALCFVGAPEMFGERERRAEIYILDWKGDLYGKEIRVSLLQKIRESRKFGSVEDLVSEMKNDLRIAKEYFLCLQEL